MTDAALSSREPRPDDYDAAEAVMARRFSVYRDLARSDVRRLVERFTGLVEVSGKAQIQAPGDQQLDVYLLVSGWAIGSIEIDERKRYIHRLYRPGDLLAIEDTNWTYATTTITALKRAKLLSIPKDDFIGMLAQDKTLSPFLFGIAMLDHVRLMDRAQANARLSARWRMAHFLLTMERDQRRFGDSPGPYFHIPLTQGQIADCIGISPVHANRAYQSLVADGYIQREGRDYQILRRDEMIAATGWIDRQNVRNHFISRAA